LSAEVRDRLLAELPAAKTIARRTLAFFKGVVDRFAEEIANFGNVPTLYAGLVDATGGLQLYDGKLRFRDAEGNMVADQIEPQQYAQYIAETTLPNSYLKAPYYKPLGVVDGVYRVGPLARLNTADRCGT